MNLPVVDVGQFAIHSLRVTLMWEPDHDAADLRVTIMVNDRDEPRHKVPIHGRERINGEAISHHRDGDFLRYFVRDAILRSLEHEVDEWLKLDGKQVTDPHPELKQTRSASDA